MQFPDKQDPARNTDKDAEFEWLLCLASALQACERRTEAGELAPERQLLPAPRSVRAATIRAAA